MHRTTKIATCCYCGTRAALVLENGRHELSCATCGAPLRVIKNLPVEPSGRKAHVGASRPSMRADTAAKQKRKDKRKKRMPWLKDLIEDVIDEVEDLFD